MSNHLTDMNYTEYGICKAIVKSISDFSIICDIGGVGCYLPKGAKLSEVVPRLEVGDVVLMVKKANRWVCCTRFQRSYG